MEKGREGKGRGGEGRIEDGAQRKEDGVFKEQHQECVFSLLWT